MIDVCTFKWGKFYTAADVNALYRAVARNCSMPFRFTAIVDDPSGIDPAIRVMRLWDDHAKVLNPQGPHKPSCYQRLKLFAADAGQWLGERIVCIDLDAIICGELSLLWNRHEPVVFYRGQWGPAGCKPRRGASRQPYCGSMFMLTAGARPQVWDMFAPAVSPGLAYAAGYRGSDQGWFGFVLGNDEAVWDESDGVYCWRNQFKTNRDKRLPSNARAVFFNGNVKPWNVTHLNWVQEHYGLHRPQN